jgi:hypothetical protein
MRVLKPGGELHIADWGKARSKLERLSYLSVQLLDGFETTTDNIRGRLPAFIRAAGFGDVGETETFSSVFGADMHSVLGDTLHVDGGENVVG